MLIVRATDDSPHCIVPRCGVLRKRNSSAENPPVSASGLVSLLFCWAIRRVGVVEYRMERGRLCSLVVISMI